MSNREPNDNASAASDQYGDLDLELFTRVAAEFKKLDRGAQLRLIRTIETFFNLQSRAEPGESRSFSVGHSATPTKLETQPSGPTFSEDRTQSPKAFMLEKRPQTDIERVACLAYYLTHYRQMPQFKTFDLSKLNTEAAQIKLGNPAQAVDNATKAGLLIQSSKGQKQISALGELYVQALPDRAAARDAISHARPRRSKSLRRGKPATEQDDN